MKKILKITLIVIMVVLSDTVKCQENFIVKTTEEYKIELPANLGEYTHFDDCVTWDLDLKNKKITYTKNFKSKDFIFIKLELNPNSTKNKQIYNFEGTDEFLTLISNEGNYIKIKLYSGMVLGSKPQSFKKIKVFTNYSVVDYNGLLSE